MPVVIARRASYDYDSLRAVFFGMMDSVAPHLIKEKQLIVIKPNLLAPASPEKAIVTHPLIIRAAVEYVLQKGAFPRISDSPAAITGSFSKILNESGIKSALEGLKVEYREFVKTKIIDIGAPFKKIEIAEDAMDADVLINLPKLKTHTQMLLTLGVKNLFGCIVGWKKPEWHVRTGVDSDMFARLLVKICKAVKPSVTVIDGILAMEGQGPGSGGKPRTLGVLMASRDPFAIDIAVCRMLGIAPDLLPTNRIAAEEGLIYEDVEIDGSLPEIKDFQLPEVTPLMFGPERFHGFFRKHLTRRPECKDPLCRLCGECRQYCPAGAITHDRERIYFDYDKCIRCYCCLEVCPQGAIQAKETLMGKMTRKLLKI